MKIIASILVFAALVASTFAVYFSVSASKTGRALADAQSDVRRLESELAATEIRTGGKVVSQDGVPAEVLRARIAELETKLAAQEAEVLAFNQQPEEEPEEEPQEEARPNETEEERRERERAEWQQRREEQMAQFREENPEEYARMREQRQEAQRRVVSHLGGQVEFFSGLKTDGLPQEYVDNHAALVEKLNVFQARIDAVNTDPEANVDRRALFGAMRELGPMLEMERQVVLNDFAMELGYAPEDTSSFVEYVDYVNQMTSARGILESMGGFGGRDGQGGGRGGRGGR